MASARSASRRSIPSSTAVVADPAPPRVGFTVGAALALVFWAALACSPGTDDVRPQGGGPEATTLTVSAAASLTDAFQELGVAYQALHPGVEVTLNLGGSAALGAQIREGAPVDVFAAADPKHLDELGPELAAPGEIFATNRLRIAVPAGNPGAVAGLADLSREELVIGLCAPGVPCGELARDALARAGIVPRPDTEEPNARALLTKVRLGEVDAGLVYVSDVLAGGPEVQGVDVREEWNPEASYAVAALERASDPEEAARFIAFVLSPEAEPILTRHGFGPVPGRGS